MTTQKIKDRYSDDVRLALLEQSITNINEALIRFEKRFDQIDIKLDRFQSEGRSHHKWTLGLISGLYFIFASSLITILIKFIH